jgi:hypothetical protein
LQPLKGDKQQTCIEAENALAHRFEPDRDSLSVHRFERQRLQNEHVQSALDEITQPVCHRLVPPDDQEEGYTSPTDCQEENHDSLHFESLPLLPTGTNGTRMHGTGDMAYPVLRIPAPAFIGGFAGNG